MDEMGDVDFKHERANPYAPPPPTAIHRMPPAETPPLHSYPPPPPGSAMPPPTPAWNPTPSPYNDHSEHRPPPPDISHQPPPYPPPPQSYQAPPPPPGPSGRESAGYPPDSGAYGRPGSVSGPSRSPSDAHQPPYHPVSSQPHEPPYYPPAPADYRARHAYPAVDAQPNGHHQPPLHAPAGHEMMPGQPAGPPPQYGPPAVGPPPPPPSAYYYDPYNAAQRRKPVRAAQACDSCRQRKAKCDEGRPECQHCKDNGLKCSYRDVPPQKSEKHVLAITTQLESLTESVKKLVSHSNAQDEKINRMLQVLDKVCAAQVAGAVAGVPEEQQPQFSQSMKAPVVDEAASSALRRSTSLEGSFVHPRASGQHSSRMINAELRTQSSNSEADAMDFSMPAKHTTAAQNLLSWPSIKALVPKGITPSYVMDEETNRGLLRLYGCGEGDDKADGHEGAPSPAGSSSSEGRRMDEEMTPSPYGVWGSGQIHQPQPSSQSHSARDHPGGVSPHGGLMLDAEAVDRYFKSFLDNIHILHPFLEPKILKHMVHTFKRKYSWDFRATQPAAAAIGTKRKRENTDSPTSVDEFRAQVPLGNRVPAKVPNTAPWIEHSIANAIVLLVMALGKVTAYRDPLPGPAPTTNIRTSTPYNNTLYSDLPVPPMPMSAPTSPFNTQAGLNGMNGVSAPSPANPQGKNIDTIPGLAYFAKAADILGEHPGGHDVSHIQANLLAGLYMGQLARIIPSYYYIHQACMAAQILIESGPYVNKTMKPARRNLINFAFWSCLQLESDIAAEMQLPLSGITRYESSHHKEMPTKLTLEPIPETSGEDDILRYYSYQIQLRLTMNSIHSTLYRASKDPQSKPSSTIMSILDENLEDWRKMLNDWDWDDEDHESPNINVARMRGKYYGAKYIIWRPAVKYALQQAEAAYRERQSDSPAPGFASPMGSQRNTQGFLPNDSSLEMEDLLRGARICIQAAIRSTTVFDKVPRRLVVTNIFGTAHAQFGNMLVLYAVFTSPHPTLRSLVDEQTLKRLHNRTIGILRENENISPILAKDLKILEHVRNKVFPSHPQVPYIVPSTSSSFSSR
ncbi:hypothetical protein ABEF95_008857 [Exophiala dermatitidis]